MTTLPAHINVQPGFELRFPSLRGAPASICVPCNEHGAVDLDELNDDARLRYLYAHTLIGRDFARPIVRCVGVRIN